MKAQGAAPFEASAIQVFRRLVGVELTRTAQTRSRTASCGPVVAIVSVAGRIHGQVVVAVDHELSLVVADALGRPVNEAVATVAGSLVLEACAVGESGRFITVTPLIVLTAQDLTLDFLSIPTTRLTLRTELGVLEIDIALLTEEEPHGTRYP